MQDVIYMDNNATTCVAEEVIDEMMPYLREQYGNPSSMHTFGGQVGKKIAQARERVAALLGCEPDEILFTSCGTESDNTAIKGTLSMHPDRRKVVTTRVEHPAVLTTCRDLERHGYSVSEIGAGDIAPAGECKARGDLADEPESDDNDLVAGPHIGQPQPMQRHRCDGPECALVE